jgi:hypothetical protein
MAKAPAEPPEDIRTTTKPHWQLQGALALPEEPRGLEPIKRRLGGSLRPCILEKE